MEKETLVLHANKDGKELTAHTPIHRNTAYHFKNSEHAANLFALKEFGSIYTRIDNPSCADLEAKIARIEGGKSALTFASGTAAIFNTIINICKTGDELIASSDLYGGTFTMFSCILLQLGIKVRFYDVNDTDSIHALVNEKTRLIYTEIIGNPSLNVSDITKLKKIKEQYHLPLVVDSTFTPPVIFKPLDYGADIVIHSLSKWISGQGIIIGGVVVDKGEFDWADEKFALYNEPDDNYHGLRFAHDLGDLNSLAFILRLRLVPLRNLGAALSPDNAWHASLAIETLDVRMKKHCENALAVAQYLEQNENVEWVRYPGLENDPSYGLAKQYFKNGYGGMVVFGIRGGRKAGEKFIDSLELTSLMANVGDSRTLAIHPASTTHSQLSEEQLIQSKSTPDLVRLSIGLENVDDIIADFKQAIEKAVS